MIYVTAATPAGIPLGAVCGDCFQTWDLHDNDPEARTFTDFVRLHLRQRTVEVVGPPPVSLAALSDGTLTAHEARAQRGPAAVVAGPWLQDRAAIAAHYVEIIARYLSNYLADTWEMKGLPVPEITREDLEQLEQVLDAFTYDAEPAYWRLPQRPTE